MNKYDENGQLKCLLDPCENCAKAKKKNQTLREKYNKEKRWATVLLKVHFGDELTKAEQKEFGVLVDKL